jgi:hypothetical protein
VLDVHVGTLYSPLTTVFGERDAFDDSLLVDDTVDADAFGF